MNAGKQSEICHRQRENKAQSPHPRSLASRPNQTDGTLCRREQDGGGSWSSRETLWKSTERVVGLDEEGEAGEEGASSQGKTLSSILFSLSSEDNMEPEGTPVSHVTPRSDPRGLLVFSISLE